MLRRKASPAIWTPRARRRRGGVGRSSCRHRTAWRGQKRYRRDARSPSWSRSSPRLTCPGGEPLYRRAYGDLLMRSREIRLAARPVGAPKDSDFELAEIEVDDPADGELVIR